MTQAPVVCANCHRPLGQLEQRIPWQNHVVCLDCHRRLASAQALPYATPAPNDAISTLIPYHNTHALIAYYLGIFAFIPFLGIFLGIAAFILGLKGLRNARENPAVRGAVHAWVGILCGGLFAFAYLLLAGCIITGLIAGR